jgi:putative membrane protein
MSNQQYPPPPPPPTSGTSLASIKTYIMVAWIFSIIIMIVWLLAGIASILSYLSLAALYGAYGQYVAVSYTGALIEGIVLLIFIIPAFLVFLRVWKMQKAVNAGDIATLKATSNMMWAIIALIFAGVIPGIMLIISDGPIKQL